MKVLVTDPISIEAIEKMKKAGLKVDLKQNLDKKELIEIIPEYDAIIVRSQTKITKDIIEAAKNLKIIGRAGTGVDNIDTEAATQRGIVVVNAPGGNSISAAEHTFALILSLVRKIPQADKSVKSGKWDRKRFMGIELRGKTIGVIGLGRVGYEVAKRAKAFEMNVLVYDPYIPPERAKIIGANLVGDLDELLEKSDIITIHVPKTKETEGMISRKEIEKMKDGVYIINCARGGIVNEKDLYEALIKGKVAGAALDVYENEPPSPSNPLFKLENVITTPHIGASTREAQISVGMIVANEIINMAKGLPVKNAVNLPSLEVTEFEYIMPYIKLAEKMGKIACARLGGKFKRVKVTFKGKLSGMRTEYITRATLKGLLETIATDVNLVSSLPLAKERGIKVEEVRSESSEVYESLLEISVSSNGKELFLAGTCFSKEDYRIIKIDKYKVDFIPAGHYIMSLHEDKPGVIGRVGTLFGKHNINIAGMIVGRYGERGGVQLMLLLVDDPPTEEVLRKMTKLDGIIDATYVYL